jgi:hypothetical protein
MGKADGSEACIMNPGADHPDRFDDSAAAG